jgi:non-heme chloroperoxidase
MLLIAGHGPTAVKRQGATQVISDVKPAQLSSGLTLPYVEQGDPSGVPVVLLHAYAESWRSFERVFAYLPPSIRAFAVTQRGHGDADRPTSGYGLQDFSADVAAFMDAVGIMAAMIVGGSSGGYVAQRFAIDHSERTLGLVLAGTPLSLRDRGSKLSEAVSELDDPIDPAFAREFVESCVFGPVSSTFLETMIGESRKMPARVWKAAFQGLREADPPTEVATITAPTVILWGDRDAYLPRTDQVALAGAISGSRLVTYAETGHTPHWEQPERVAADVVALAERITPRHTR